MFFDTNILIDVFAEYAEAKTIIRNAPARLISFIVKIEFMAGLHEPKIQKIGQNLISQFEIINVTQTIIERTIIIRRQKRLKLADAIIYATAQEYGTKLVTRNTKDFDADDPLIHVPYHV